MPKISIIVPVYKVEEYLCTCIESLQIQTFQNIEIILVDDGSPDSCGDICDRYSKVDDRICVIHQTNKGLSCARNVGVSHATGEYICFVDSDDFVAPNYCEVLLHLLEDSEYDFSVCGTCRFEDGKEPQTNLKNNTITIYRNTEFLKAQLTKKSEFGVWNKLYRKELFDKIIFAEGKIHEDVIWSGDLAQNLFKNVIVTSQQLYFYRQRRNSIVSSHINRCSPDRVYAGEYLIDVSKAVCPELFSECLRYAIEYPWMLVDGIYVRREFKENKRFLIQLQALMRKYYKEYSELECFSKILRFRMKLFARSRALYAINAYFRLLRVYIYHIIKRDPYADGHGI